MHTQAYYKYMFKQYGMRSHEPHKGKLSAQRCKTEVGYKITNSYWK